MRHGARHRALAATLALAVWLLLVPAPTVVGAVRSARARSAPLRLIEAPAARPAPIHAHSPGLPMAGLPPLVRQSTATSCGAAALATLLGWRGRPVSEHAVLRHARLRADGITLGEFARLAATFGLPGAWYRTPRDAIDRVPLPFVAHLDRDGGHYVVVRGRSADHLLLADPALGWRVVSRDRFLRAFRGRVFVPDRTPSGGPA